MIFLGLLLLRESEQFRVFHRDQPRIISDFLKQTKQSQWEKSKSTFLLIRNITKSHSLQVPCVPL